MTTSQAGSVSVELPPRLDYAAGAAVLEKLKDADGSALVVDARQVSHLGAYAAQVLLATQQDRAKADQAFSIQASEAFVSCWRILGFPETAIEQMDKS